MIKSNSLDTLLNRFNLFAPNDGGGSGAGSDGAGANQGGNQGAGDDGSGDGSGDGDGSKKTFTREEMAGIVSAQAKKLLDNFKANDLKKMLDEAKAEGEKQAQMTAEEKAEEQRKQAQADLEAREAKLARREAEADTRSLMADKDIPESLRTVLLPSVTGLDADKRGEALDTFKKAFDAAVQTATLNKAKGKHTPATGSSAGAGSAKKFSEMTFEERTQLYRDDPEQYQILKSQG